MLLDPGRAQYLHGFDLAQPIWSLGGVHRLQQDKSLPPGLL
ncbi:hypothetical protein ACFVFJ_48995 [Streptomyces sp. NPDC057717]